MDLVEPLNSAHRIQRRAEAEVLCGQFDSAVRNFRIAADRFDEALSSYLNFDDLDEDKKEHSTSDSLVFKTLRKQKEFCIRQAELLTFHVSRSKNMNPAKGQHLTVTTACDVDLYGRNESILESTDRHFSTLNNLDLETSPVARCLRSPNDFRDLKTKVFENFERHDTLLNELTKNDTNDDTVSINEQQELKSESSNCQKTDKEIIEELKQCNADLRCYVLELFRFIDVNHDTNDILQPDESENLAVISVGKAQSDNDDTQNDPLFHFPPLELPAYSPPSDFT